MLRGKGGGGLELVGAVGEVGGAGKDVGVRFVLEVNLAQILEAVSRAADLG